jgi:hypothetical protein
MTLHALSLTGPMTVQGANVRLQSERGHSRLPLGQRQMTKPQKLMSVLILSGELALLPGSAKWEIASKFGILC